MTEPVAAWREVAVRYPFARTNAVGPISLKVGKGERVLLLGPSGCGKSTLLQSLTGVIPQTIPATISGQITIFGEAVAARQPADWAGVVGQLFQDADQTLCGFRIEDEIAYGMENRCVPAADIAAAVRDAMARVDLPTTWRSRRIATLSGGEKQLVALAAVMAQQAPLIVADEPTANLAPAVAARLAAFLLQPRGEGGALIVDHRSGQILQLIDRIVVLGPEGQILAEGSPDTVFHVHGDRMEALGIWTPLACRLVRKLARAGIGVPHCLTIHDLCRVLETHGHGVKAARVLESTFQPRALSVATPVVRLCRVDCAPLFGPVVLRDVSLQMKRGEVLGVLGANGTGKTTLSQCLAGLVRPARGMRDGPMGAIAFQNPEAHFTQATVLAEMQKAGAVAGKDLAHLADWGLEGQRDQHPFTLSQGQKRRLALAILTATDRWPVLVLDEPTSGLDQRGADTIARHIARLAQVGRAIAVVTHDMDFALTVCDRVVVLAEGGVVSSGPARTVLRDEATMTRAGLALPAVSSLLDWLEHKGC